MDHGYRLFPNSIVNTWVALLKLDRTVSSRFSRGPRLEIFYKADQCVDLEQQLHSEEIYAGVSSSINLHSNVLKCDYMLTSELLNRQGATLI